MWIYKQTEKNTFTIGYYDENNLFQSEAKFESKTQAAARVHYLNGGNNLEPKLIDINDTLNVIMLDIQSITELLNSRLRS